MKVSNLKKGFNAHKKDDSPLKEASITLPISGKKTFLFAWKDISHI
jgi:hypothetical protein